MAAPPYSSNTNQNVELSSLLRDFFRPPQTIDLEPGPAAVPLSHQEAELPREHRARPTRRTPAAEHDQGPRKPLGVGAHAAPLVAEAQVGGPERGILDNGGHRGGVSLAVVLPAFVESCTAGAGSRP